MRQTISRMRRGGGGVIVCSALFLLIPLCAAWSQGFMVKPMRIEVQAGAGDTTTVDIEVRNSLAAEQTVLARRINLWQDPNGSWAPLKEEEAQEQPDLRSCIDWLSLDADSLDLGQYGSKEFQMTIDVPRTARGTYSAALLVRSEEPERQGGVAVVIQFLIPITVEVEGTSARERVNFTDVELAQSNDDEEARRPAALVAHLSNDGETLVRVGGELRLMSPQGNGWRPVATVPLRTRSMLPGVELALEGSVGRRLPSGTYKVEGRLHANGRRLGTVTREVEFEGDPEATLLADMPLEVDELAALELVPGSTRSGSVTVKNPSTETSQVEARVLQHPATRGVGNEELDGSELDASEWITVMPDSFPLRGDTERALRLLVRAPKLEKPLPNYYALLRLESSYEDGQDAGGGESLLWLRNEAVESRLEAEGLSLQLTDDEPGKYAVTARFVNSGTIHWSGRCSAEVRVSATEAALSANLETTTPVLLPLGTGTWSGVLDFSDVEAGEYVLNVALSYSGEEEAQQLQIEVTVGEDGTRVVEVVGEDTDNGQGGDGE
ncbi:MAG: hypothetical protein R6V07_13905 [Armatimonadota bacterium]